MSGKASRDRGIRWERLVARFLGTVTTRSTRPGVADDAADVVLPGWLVEAKDHARWTVSEWFRQLESKCQDDETPVLVLKRRQRPTGDALVVMRLDDWNEMRKEALWWPNTRS